MNHILVGSVRYNPTHHIIDILNGEIKNTDIKKLVRVYFLDHRIDTRIGMADHIVKGDGETGHDITYKISECTGSILSELIYQFEIETRYSECLVRIILFFNLDSIDSVDPSVVRSILDNIQIVMKKLDIHIICHTSSRFVDREILDRFDTIHMFKDTATESLDELMTYLTDTHRYYQVQRLRKLISVLDKDSSESIEIDSIRNMFDSDLSRYGRIIVTSKQRLILPR